MDVILGQLINFDPVIHGQRGEGIGYGHGIGLPLYKHGACVDECGHFQRMRQLWGGISNKMVSKVALG